MSQALHLVAMKLIRLLEYGSFATLLLAAGDISPNPSWTYLSINGAGLNISHLNIQSLPKHLDELKIFLQDNPFDVLCLSETWLNETWTDTELCIDDYNIIRMDRAGAAIYYNSKFMARQRHNIFSSGFDSVWLELSFPKKSKILISSVYRPPNSDFDKFKMDFEEIMGKLSPETKETIIIGRFQL